MMASAPGSFNTTRNTVPKYFDLRLRECGRCAHFELF